MDKWSIKLQGEDEEKKKLKNTSIIKVAVQFGKLI
jgi:hypothetical protein